MFPLVAVRAFPVLYAENVEQVAAFYGRLGLVEHVRVPGQDGGTGFIGLRRDGALRTSGSPGQRSNGTRTRRGGGGG